MEKSRSNRIQATPSSYAKAHYLYVQEVGTLESIEPHVSSRKNLNSFLLLIVTSGKGQLTHKGQLYTLAAGDCAYINCDDPYSHESSDVEPWTLTWVHFNGKEAGAFYHNFTEQGNSPIFKPIQYDAFIECFHHLYESSKNQTFLNELLANKYLVELITLCFTQKQDRLLPEDFTLGKLSLIQEYIDKHFQEKLSLDELSTHFYISKFHLSREYKKVYGITIGAYILSKRISKAKSLLRFSEQSVESIAIACGFMDSGYFIKVFKGNEGMTPLEYRHRW